MRLMHPYYRMYLGVLQDHRPGVNFLSGRRVSNVLPGATKTAITLLLSRWKFVDNDENNSLNLEPRSRGEPESLILTISTGNGLAERVTEIDEVLGMRDDSYRWGS